MPTGASSRIAQRRRAAQAEGAADYAARRLELVRTAALVFREKGYTSATLNDVAEKVGIDRASLYYYVGSKEELFQECIQGVLDDNLAQAIKVAAMEISARAKIEKLVEVVLASYEANYPYMYVYIQEDMSKVTSLETEWASKMVAQTKRLQRLFLDILEDGVAAGGLRADLPVGLVANGLFGMINWTHRWYVPSAKVNAPELARTFTSVFFDGFSIEDK